MAKEGLKGSDVEAVLRTLSRGSGWSLCIGAGASMPVFPSWPELVKKLAAIDPKATPDMADRLLLSYSPDALIEAAKHILKLDDIGFSQLLTTELYSHLKDEAGPKLWPDIVRCLETDILSNVKLSQWESFITFFQTHPIFSKITALELSEIITESLNKDFAPFSILSFNAEPLLFALINAQVARKHDWIRPHGAQNPPKQSVDKLTRGISNRVKERVQYIFCHGLLPVLDSEIKKPNSNSVDKLVFSETQYLTLSNAVMSWQATSFVESCMNRTMVFVGVSLSDSNMRNWLSRVAQNKIKELNEVFGHNGDSTSHFWIQKHPGSESEATWIESSVSHLGVRLVWVSEWDEVGTTLRKMLGI